MLTKLKAHDSSLISLGDEEMWDILLDSDVVCLCDIHGVNAVQRELSRLTHVLACSSRSASESTAVFLESLPMDSEHVVSAWGRESASHVAALLQASWPWPTAEYERQLPRILGLSVQIRPCGVRIPEAVPPSGTPDAMRQPIAWMPVADAEDHFRVVNARVIDGVSQWLSGNSPHRRHALVLVGLEHVLGAPENIVPTLLRKGLKATTVIPFVPDFVLPIRALQGEARTMWLRVAPEVYVCPALGASELLGIAEDWVRREAYWRGYAFKRVTKNLHTQR
jgi:hypothetical protein